MHVACCECKAVCPKCVTQASTQARIESIKLVLCVASCQSWAGESEQGLRGVFAAARRLAPAIVFIDEVDAIAPSRCASQLSQQAGVRGSHAVWASSAAPPVAVVTML
jgi:ATP-dependent 26S proteasome regulatory subunit